MKKTDKKEKKEKREAAPGTFRERFRQAADGLKERAKGMNGEEKKAPEAQEAPEERAQETAPGAEEAQEQGSEQLKEQLAKAQAERDEYLDLAQRKQAEFANYRRRTEGIRKEAYDDGVRETVEKLLPVVDNLERALSSAGEEESSLKSGVELVLRQTLDTLTKLGVSEIEAQGAPFDAELMNAVLQGESGEGEPGTVCQVLQKGYRLGERVIRHAMVKVVPQ